MPLNLVMLGAPGAGKGTQAERFSRAHGIPRISTGDILREAVHAGTETGRRARSLMDRGELVSDDVMIGIVKERLDQEDTRNGFVLDGFPRTVAQAQALDGVDLRGPLIVVDIVVPEPELVRRLGIRLICGNCGVTALPGNGVAAVCAKCGGALVQRTDDADAIVGERLSVYRRDTKPLVEYYRARPTFCSIDGTQTPDRVAAGIASAVEIAVRAGTRAMEGQSR